VHAVCINGKCDVCMVVDDEHCTERPGDLPQAEGCFIDFTAAPVLVPVLDAPDSCGKDTGNHILGMQAAIGPVSDETDPFREEFLS